MKMDSCLIQVPPAPLKNRRALQPTPHTAPQPPPGNKEATSPFACAVEPHTSRTTSQHHEERCAGVFPAAATFPSTPNPSDSETGACRGGGRMRLRFQ